MADADAEKRVIALVDECKKDGDTLGGIVEVCVTGLPPGLGSYVHWDRKVDGRLAGALLSIQACKGAELGAGFGTARVRGSEIHDEIVRTGARDRPLVEQLRRHRGRHDHRRAAASSVRRSSRSRP